MADVILVWKDAGMNDNARHGSLGERSFLVSISDLPIHTGSPTSGVQRWTRKGAKHGRVRSACTARLGGAPLTRAHGDAEPSSAHKVREGRGRGGVEG